MTALSSLRGVSVRFDDVEAVAGIDFDLHRGRITAIAGPNGAGKTTLLRLLAGILEADEGVVEVLGMPSPAAASGQPRQNLRQRIAYISQRPALDPEMTGRETLTLLATLYGFGGQARQQRLDEVIAAYSLTTFLDRPIGGYSGGQKRRLHLAGCLLHDPELILLDEPTAGLDGKGKQNLWADLHRRADSGAAVAIISHDERALEEHADTIVSLEYGQIDEEKHIRSRQISQQEPPDERPVHAIEASWQVCRRAWIKTLRRPVTLTFSLAQPLIWMGFFGFLFERYQLAGAADIRYLDFLVPGVCAMTVLFGASQSGVSWIRDLNSDFLPRLLSTPASPHSLLIGKIAADVLRLLLQAIAVLLLALLLGARLSPTPGAAAYGLLALLLFAAAFSCLSCAIALKLRVQEAMATFIHLVNMPMLFTSTALVPARQMPAWLKSLANYNPLTLAVDAWRGALLHGQAPPIGHLVALAALTFLLYLAAAREMRGVARLS